MRLSCQFRNTGPIFSITTIQHGMFLNPLIVFPAEPTQIIPIKIFGGLVNKTCWHRKIPLMTDGLVVYEFTCRCGHRLLLPAHMLLPPVPRLQAPSTDESYAVLLCSSCLHMGTYHKHPEQMAKVFPNRPSLWRQVPWLLGCDVAGCKGKIRFFAECSSSTTQEELLTSIKYEKTDGPTCTQGHALKFHPSDHHWKHERFDREEE